MKKFNVVALAITLCCLSLSAWAVSKSIQPGDTFRDCPDCPEMVVLPAGNFLMGLSTDEAKRDAKQESFTYKIVDSWRWSKTVMPQHPVKIQRPFALGKYPVTRGEFAAFVRETGYSANQPCFIAGGRYGGFSSEADWRHPGFDQSDRDPVVCVSWDEARAYVDWINKKLAQANPVLLNGWYYLPSEAEWEYAARAGTRTTRWWGNAIGSNKAVCLHCGTPWDHQQPAPVGLYGANSFHLYDMLGNVWQWTKDCWNLNYAGAPADGGAWLVGNCAQRVLRGGSWRSAPEYLTSTARLFDNAHDHYDLAGFRVSKEIPEATQNIGK